MGSHILASWVPIWWQSQAISYSQPKCTNFYLPWHPRKQPRTIICPICLQSSCAHLHTWVSHRACPQLRTGVGHQHRRKFWRTRLTGRQGPLPSGRRIRIFSDGLFRCRLPTPLMARAMAFFISIFWRVRGLVPVPWKPEILEYSLPSVPRTHNPHAVFFSVRHHRSVTQRMPHSKICLRS